MTPVSHLCSERLFLDFIPNYGWLEARDQSVPEALQEQIILYHCDLEITHSWNVEQRSALIKKVRSYPKLQGISFHMVTNNTAYILKHGVAHGVGRTLTRAELLDNALENIGWLKANLPSLEIMVENNNDLGTECYELVTDPGFITDVVVSNDIFFLYDHSHAKISAHNRDMDFLEYFHGLPLQKTRQVHFSEHDVVDGKWVDAHNLPNASQYQFCIESLGRLPLYLTIEYYKDIGKLLDALSSLKSIIEASGHER